MGIILGGLAIGLIGLVIVAGVLLWAAQERIMFRGRTSDILETPAEKQWPVEEVWVESAGGRTHGWWLPLDGARGVVMFSHGSGKNISHYLDDAAIFRGMGFSVLLYDYGGYGESTGKPGEKRCYADSRAMWKYLTETRQIDPSKIVLAGCSMGGGVTSDIAAEVTARAVILESTFTSVPDTFQQTIFPVPSFILSRLQFRNIDKAPHIKSPVLVVHSTDDTVVPFAQGRKLYEAITSPKQFVAIHGSHGQGKFDSGEVYTTGVKAFLDTYFPAP